MGRPWKVKCHMEREEDQGAPGDGQHQAPDLLGKLRHQIKAAAWASPGSQVTTFPLCPCVAETKHTSWLVSLPVRALIPS